MRKRKKAYRYQTAVTGVHLLRIQFISFISHSLQHDGPEEHEHEEKVCIKKNRQKYAYERWLVDLQPNNRVVKEDQQYSDQHNGSMLKCSAGFSDFG